MLLCDTMVRVFHESGDDVLTKGCPACRAEHGYGEVTERDITSVKCLQEVTVRNDYLIVYGNHYDF